MGSFSSTGILLIWLHLQTSFASVIIQRCPLSATENTQNYHIICSGFDRNVKIEWKVDFGDGYGEINHGECPGINSCQSRYPLERDITRPTMDTSHMIINNVTRLYSKAIFKCLISNSEDANCLMDVIYGAEVSECKVQIIKGELWTINGSCYIQKGFSSRNNYSCELLQRENSGSSTTLGKKTFNPSLNNENPPYASGSCSFTGLGFPTNSANYNYTFNIIPGNINIQAGVIIVEKPTIKPVVACPPIVKENSTLTCSCNSSNLGKPKGRLAFYRGNSLLVGGNYGDAMLNFSKRTLFRNESESSYRCVLDWATASNEDVYTQFYIIIAYGPDTVSLTGPDVFDIDPRNNVTLTLMCLPSEAKPNVSILWSERCTSAIGKTCIMTPTIQDDDVMITCTVTNVYAEVTKVTARKLVVNYPPSTPPLIHGYSNGEILYAEDSLSMTCTVKGGKPVNETKVMFSCPGKRIDTSDIQGVTEMNSSLTFLPLETDDHNKTCTCSAQWKNTNFYTMQTGIKLTVYSPPSNPVITSSSSEYPFIAGVTVNASLLCVSNNTGQPAATYTWMSAEDGVPSTDGLGRGKLTFYSLRPEHHNRTITCLATNAFTTAKRIMVKGIFSLNVYYRPNITIVSENGNDCLQIDILQTCSVFEDQPTRLRCSASSNPPPESVSWSNKFGMQSNNNTIDIQRTNRTLDNVNFTCKASTRVLDNIGLALVGEKNITVIVKYSPDDINMTINSNSSIFTANENETVVIECMANGRPTPKLDLYQHEKRVGGEDGGKLISTDDFTRMYYVLGNASCEHNGLYKCIAHNTVGKSMNKTSRLQVRCKPQLFGSNQTSSDHIPSMNYNGHPAILSFLVIAFPSVNKYNITSLDKNLSTVSSNMDESFFKLGCVPLSMDSVFNCSITVDGITNSQKGNYTAIVGNSLGSYAYTFEVTVNAIRISECESYTSAHSVTKVNEAAMNFTLTCYGFQESDTVVWMNHSRNVSTLVGTCPPSGPCNLALHEFLVTRPRGNLSLITVTSPIRDKRDYAFSCGISGAAVFSDMCHIDVIYPAEVSSCSIKTSNKHWMGNASCDITKVFSSIGNYSCQWYIGTSQVEQPTFLSSSTFSPSNYSQQYFRQGSCMVMIDLPKIKGSYFYRGVVYPGGTSLVYGPITFDPPSPPEISNCAPAPIIISGSQLTCTCSTRNIGQPEGRLLWFYNSTLLRSGEYGKVFLVLTSHSLDQDDHGGQFTCLVDWIQASQAATFKPVVGYKSYVSNLTLSGNPDVLTINESSSVQVQLLCVARGRPTPEISLMQEGQRELTRHIGGNLEKDQVLLSYQVSSNCESTGRYSCETNNNIGEADVASVALYVQCSPRLASSSNIVGMPSINFKGLPRNLTFDVISFPHPEQFSFVYLGNTYNTTATQQPARRDLFKIGCSSGDVLLARVKCTLTVDKVNEGDQGYYDVVVINSFGNTSFFFRLAINETEPSELQKDKSVKDSNTSKDIIIGVSVAAAVGIIAAVVAIILFIRWKRIHLQDRPRHPEHTETTHNSSPEIKDTIYDTAEPYAPLRIQDIGLSSPYDEINQYELCSQSRVRETPSQTPGTEYVNTFSVEHTA